MSFDKLSPDYKDSLLLVAHDLLAYTYSRSLFCLSCAFKTVLTRGERQFLVIEPAADEQWAYEHIYCMYAAFWPSQSSYKRVIKHGNYRLQGALERMTDYHYHEYGSVTVSDMAAEIAMAAVRRDRELFLPYVPEHILVDQSYPRLPEPEPEPEPESVTILPSSVTLLQQLEEKNEG